VGPQTGHDAGRMSQPDRPHLSVKKCRAICPILPCAGKHLIVQR
jgi:hypothetical protein